MYRISDTLFWYCFHVWYPKNGLAILFWPMRSASVTIYVLLDLVSGRTATLSIPCTQFPSGCPCRMMTRGHCWGGWSRLRMTCQDLRWRRPPRDPAGRGVRDHRGWGQWGWGRRGHRQPQAWQQHVRRHRDHPNYHRSWKVPARWDTTIKISFLFTW